MNRSLRVVLTLGTTGAALLAAPTTAAQAAGTAMSARPTAAQIAMMSPAAQNRLLDPLRAIAGAVDTAGKKSDPGSYAGVRIDAPAGLVHLYTTVPADAPGLLQAARRTDPGLDTSRVEVDKAAFTLRALHAARSSLLAEADAHELPYKVYSVAVAPDGSALDVAVDKPDTARADLPAAGATDGRQANTFDGITVVFQQGSPITPASWADVKWHDSSPFIGGDVLTDGSSYCSAGLPAVRTSDGHPIMVTANHCFPTGDRVYTGAGTTPTTGNFYNDLNGQEGNYVGTVTGTSGSWDAEELDGANNNSDESDSTTWEPVTSDAYSYTGDYVCQDGAASFFMGYGTVCAIEVTNQDITYSLTDWSGTHNVRGVEGTRLPGEQWAVGHGDSGAMVFAVSGSTRQARGVVSALTDPYQTEGGSYIYWTEAPDILGHFGLKLNPTT